MMLKTGRYVLFELLSDCEVHIQIVTPNGVKHGVITKEYEINILLATLQRASDGRLVGVYQSAQDMRNADGTCVSVPACVVPQRAAMLNGGHDIYYLTPGETQAYRLMVPADKVKRLVNLTNRSDIPADKILAPDYDPSDLCDVTS